MTVNDNSMEETAAGTPIDPLTHAAEVAALMRAHFPAFAIASVCGLTEAALLDTIFLLRWMGLPLPVLSTPPTVDPAVLDAARSYLERLGSLPFPAPPAKESILLVRDAALVKRVPAQLLIDAYASGKIPAIWREESLYFWRPDLEHWQAPPLLREPIEGRDGEILALVNRGFSLAGIAEALEARNVSNILVTLQRLAMRGVEIGPVRPEGDRSPRQEAIHIQSILPAIRALLPEAHYPYHLPAEGGWSDDGWSAGVTDADIRHAWRRLVEGMNWEQVSRYLPISRQRFDVRRRKLHLPPPRHERFRRQQEMLTQTPLKSDADIREARAAAGWLTLPEAAAAIGIEEGTLAAQARRGRIPSEREGVRLYFHRDAVETYRIENKRQPAAQSFPGGYLPTGHFAEKYTIRPADLYEAIADGRLVARRFGANWGIREEDFQRFFAPIRALRAKRLSDAEIREAWKMIVKEGYCFGDLKIASRITERSFKRRLARLAVTDDTAERVNEQLLAKTG